MSIYFIQRGDDGPVKIGFTADIATRFTMLQSASPEAAKLIRLIKGDKGTEKEIHRLFEKDHIRGEWFSFNKKMLATGEKEEAPRHMTRERPNLQVRRTIDALGISETGRILGMSRTAIKTWHANDAVPHWQEDRFASLAEHLPKPKRKAAK